MSGGSLMEVYNSKRVWRMCLVASLGSFTLGYNLGVINSTLGVIAVVFDWGDNKHILTAIMAGMTPLASMITAIISPRISDKIGRKKGLMVGSLISMAGAVVTGIPFTITFGLGRFITGLSVGVYASLIPLYLNEVSPIKMRGKMGVLVQSQVTIGIVVAYILSLALPTGDYKSNPLTYWWIVMYLFQGFVTLFQFLMFLFIYKLETPTWLQNKNLKYEALQSLRQVYEEETAQEMLLDLDMSTSVDIESTSSIDSEITYIPSYSDLLLCKNNTGRLMRIGIAVSFLQQLVGFGSIMSFSTHIFGVLGGGVFMARVYTLILGIINMLSALSAIYVITRFGRKTLMVFGCAMVAICQFASGLLAGPLSGLSILISLAFIIVFLVSFSVSIGSLCWLYTGEIMTSRGMSICAGSNRLFNTVSMVSFPLLDHAFGIAVVFWIYAGIGVFGFIYCMLDMIETKGLSKQEIQKLLMRKSV